MDLLQTSFFNFSLFQAKEWLCLKCQMQRSVGEAERIGHPVVKAEPSQSTISMPPVPGQKTAPAAAQKEKVEDLQETKKNISEATVRKPGSKPETAASVVSQKAAPEEKTQIVSKTEQEKAKDATAQIQPIGKPPETQPSQATRPKVAASVSKQVEAEKPPQQPPKSPTPAAKSAPAPGQPSKQESGGFFGFGAPKLQPTKSAESVTGKMFGFGSSIFSSASTLITTAVQDEPKTTPPTPRKMSTQAQEPGKAKSPVSPKMSPAKTTKSPEQISETNQQVKTDVKTIEKAKEDKPSTAVPKEQRSTCPLCKIELNMGSKDPPNYNTCTECKNVVCNLCGFNPMPHTGAVSYTTYLFLCLTMKSNNSESYLLIMLLLVSFIKCCIVFNYGYLPQKVKMQMQ